MILNAGLDLEIRDGKLFFNGVAAEPLERTAEEMKDVISSAADSETVYLIYRNIFDKRHAGIFEKHGMRYDITVILPKMLGNEFAKTLGHYHSLSKTVSYTEIYEVLSGRAHFLLQKTNGSSVVDAVVLEAEEGDTVIVPPGYGHVTINPSDEILVVANLQSAEARADYDPVKNLRGAAYFETRKGFEKNANYTNHRLRLVKAGGLKEKYLGSTKPIYSIFVRSPEKFDFLRYPEKYSGVLEKSIG